MWCPQVRGRWSRRCVWSSFFLNQRKKLFSMSTIGPSFSCSILHLSFSETYSQYNKWESRGSHLWQSGGRDIESWHSWHLRSIRKVRRIENGETTPKESKTHSHIGSCLQRGFEYCCSEYIGSGSRIAPGQLKPNVQVPRSWGVWGRGTAGVNLQRGTSDNIKQPCSKALGWFVLLGWTCYTHSLSLVSFRVSPYIYIHTNRQSTNLYDTYLSGSIFPGTDNTGTTSLNSSWSIF